MRYLRILFHALGASLSLAMTMVAVALLSLVLGLGWWVQSEGSLAQALHLVARLLPAGQTLQAQEVRGSLKNGGHIGHLLWMKDALSVEAESVQLDWTWQSLLERELRVPNLHVHSLHVQDQSPKSKTALSELVLPLHVDVLFTLDQLVWAGPPAMQLDALKGHYRYDGTTHSLQDASLAMAAGSYQGHAEVQARSPMALSVQVAGTVQTTLKVQQQPLLLVAEASAQGKLLGSDATVDVRMALQPQGPIKSRPLGAMQASLQAQIKPTQDQPLANGQAQWSALDLASLWPQAPHTSLEGQAKVLPDDGGWKADIQLQNSMAGTLDAQRLPLSSATAKVLYRNSQWLLSDLQANVAGGTVQAQGSYAGSPQRWSAKATVQGVEPARLDTHWQFPVLHGELSAQDTEHGIAFETRLGTPLQGTAPDQEARLEAKGLWSAPVLQVQSLLLQTAQARLSGQLAFDSHGRAGTAHLQGAAPGATLALDGELAEAAGEGSSRLQVTDAHALLQWLAKVPVLGRYVGDWDAQGSAEASLHWSGGWQRQGQDLQLQAMLGSQRLDLQDQQVRELQLGLSGSLRDLALQLHGKLQSGATQLALQAQAHGGMRAEGQWHGRVETLQLQASNALYSAPWIMDLRQPVELEWRQQTLQQAFTLAEGGLRLSGPAPGTAQIQWQPVQWSHQGASGNGVAPRWSTRGQLQGVPLAWLEVLGQTRLVNLGLRGDLLFGGHWDASGGETLRLSALLERSSGDLQLLSSDPAVVALSAGLKDAHVALEIENQNLHAALVWASEAGGNAQAEFSTRLQTAGGVVRWPVDAPLQGSVRASLPRVGAWSLVAPVGWRIQGTLEADATLSGSRNKPGWKGTLEARDMSVRSVVDGIDFSQGVMRLQVSGQHLEIAQLELQGAGGAAGGRLQISGSADWLAGAGGATAGTAASRVRMALQAKAQNFRVSAKPDQRLVVTGDLNAQLSNARLVLRGALVADQALFVLPEDTAPRLGVDVVVKRKSAPGKNVVATPKPAAASPKLAQTVVPDISITLDPGTNFQLSGHGLNTRLAGLLTLKAEGLNATPKLLGELHTVAGTYRAYGQNLNIEQGTLRFGGAYDNPALDILALRPNLTQEVGVEISGTAQLPVVRLYSNPDLPDADKLSWLVLGHAANAGGAENAMLQQAALALLAGSGKSPTSALVNAFGIDEVSLGQAATTNLDGTSGSETTVKLGKRISRDFYVAYERGLSGTFGAFYVFYDLSRRFTLRAESGAQNAVDLIFTTRFD
jgi:translocation and assembly module TamB